jgi:hypothetical protein
VGAIGGKASTHTVRLSVVLRSANNLCYEYSISGFNELLILRIPWKYQRFKNCKEIDIIIRNLDNQAIWPIHNMWTFYPKKAVPLPALSSR